MAPPALLVRPSTAARQPHPPWIHASLILSPVALTLSSVRPHWVNLPTSHSARLVEVVVAAEARPLHPLDDQ